MALGGPGCGKEAPRPNVLIITVDTVRADHVGCYGFGLAHTPAMDRLAAEGVRCSDAATAAPITLPAHSSILTGLYPPAHGVRDNGNYALGPEAVTLAERLSTAGYRTGAFVSAAVLARRYGLDQGFGVYDDDLWSEDEPELFMIRERPAGRTVDHVLTWLANWRAQEHAPPFFLWVHLFDAHQPYRSPSTDLALLVPTPYDAAIAEADRGIGRLLAWLGDAGALDGTLVVLTADHGESLGEHGEATHGVFIYDATIRVPLIWRFPGVLPAGATYAGPVRHIDIVPTVLGMLGLPGAESTQGTDLTGALQGRVAPPDLVQYSEARLAEEGFGMAPLFGVRHDGFKWIRAPRPELYDLRHDPRELANLLPAQASPATKLETRLEAILAESGARALTARTRTIDRETEEMLRALGYLTSPEDRAGMGGRDPKDGMALYAKLQAARQLAQAGEWDRCRALLADVLREAPENVTARNVLAFVAVRQGDHDEAERQYLASLAEQPRQHRVLGALGVLAIRRGDFDVAEARFRQALELAPTFVEAMSNLGWIEATRGHPAGAQEWYEKAIAIDPTYPHVYRRLADLFYDQRDWPDALDYYRRVLAVVPAYFEVLIQAGNAARFLEDRAGARAYYEQAARARPDSWIPAYNLACLSALDEDAVGAFARLHQAIDLGFAAPGFLQQNEDFAALRARPEWREIVAQVEEAARRISQRGAPGA